MKEEIKKMIDLLNCIDDRQQLGILYSFLKTYLDSKDVKEV
ncbi:hypothetical protein [Clostridium perfringens]|jgi:hypothetical protein|nr:hypothetical protein [Clostridium perfringens]